MSTAIFHLDVYESLCQLVELFIIYWPMFYYCLVSQKGTIFLGYELFTFQPTAQLLNLSAMAETS